MGKGFPDSWKVSGIQLQGKETTQRCLGFQHTQTFGKFIERAFYQLRHLGRDYKYFGLTELYKIVLSPLENLEQIL